MLAEPQTEASHFALWNNKMRIEYLSKPAVEPVLLDECKEHLRIDGTHEDTYLAALIASSRAALEASTGLHFVSRSVNLYLDSWGLNAPFGLKQTGCSEHLVPIGGSVSGMANRLVLPLRPIAAITSIGVFNGDDSLTVWPAENYVFSPGLEPVLSLRQGGSWPSVALQYNGIQITADVGFGASWNNVPDDIRHALLALVAYQYYHRGDTALDGENLLSQSGAAGLVAAYRQVRL